MIILSNSGFKSGLREWILQRFSGVVVGSYFLFLLFFFKIGNDITYDSFLSLFSCFYFKLFSILFVYIWYEYILVPLVKIIFPEGSTTSDCNVNSLP